MSESVLESLLEFPCTFPIKVMGRAEAGLSSAVLDIVVRHAPDFDVSQVETRSSRQGKYLSLTCTIQARSRQQLDALYLELCDHPAVITVL